MRRCAFCQGELDPATLICRACGRVQPPTDDDITLTPAPGEKGALTRRCPHCNERLPASARFCGRCGQPIVPLAGEAPGKALHDTSAPPEIAQRDPAITSVLEQPARLADMPTKLTRQGGDARLRSGVAHGLRYRLLRRAQARVVEPAPPPTGVFAPPPVRRRGGMQGRIAVAALVALLVVGGAVGTQTSLFTGPGHSGGAVATATATSAALATPTATATPSSGVFRVSPASFSQICAGAAALSPLQVTLDNRSGGASATWQAAITQTDPKGHIWATASPARGTVPAGQTANVTIRPISTLCQDMQGSAGAITYTVSVKYSESGQTGSLAVTDTVTPPG
ncbi:MAG TPA: zinc ribbon domain-containing protein [Ktedonobacterales bacterium]|jgi:hypothetical protein